MSDNENDNGMSGSEQSQSDGVVVDAGEAREGGDTEHVDSKPTSGCDDDVGDESLVEEECVICFEALTIQEWGRCTPCGHVFHKKCWRAWEDAHNRRIHNEFLRHGRLPRSEDGCKCCLCNQINQNFVNSG